MSTYPAGDPGPSSSPMGSTSTSMGSTGTAMGSTGTAMSPSGTTMTTPTTSRDRLSVHSGRRDTTETKPAFKTTELIAYVACVLGVLIASAVIDEGADGQGFGAESAWFFVSLLTIGYMISRGLAKAGSYEKDHDPRT